MPIQSLGDGKGIATSVCTGVSLVYPTSNGYIQIRGRALSYYLRDEELRYKGEEKERRPPTPRLSKTHTFVLLPLDPRVSPARSGRHVPLFLISPASSLTATVDREVRKEEEEERDREDGAEGGVRFPLLNSNPADAHAHASAAVHAVVQRALDFAPGGAVGGGPGDLGGAHGREPLVAEGDEPLELLPRVAPGPDPAQEPVPLPGEARVEERVELGPVERLRPVVAVAALPAGPGHRE